MERGRAGHPWTPWTPDSLGDILHVRVDTDGTGEGTGEGTLRLGVSLEGDVVVVEVGDSGTGIEPAIQHRVFEPFFTTKDVGRGTGLGLDISRRIVVDRHGGSIEFESTPGSTTATVRIPRVR